MRLQRAKYYLVIIFSFLLFKGKAQEVFRTINGSMLLTTTRADTTFTAQSHEVIVLLNYETAGLKIRVDKSSIRTGNDSLDHRLSLRRKDMIVFTGSLSLDYVNIESTSPQRFTIEGTLKHDSNESTVKGEGKIEQMETSKSDIQGVLELSFRLNKEDLGFAENELPDFRDEFTVQILQATLKRVTD